MKAIFCSLLLTILCGCHKKHEAYTGSYSGMEYTETDTQFVTYTLSYNKEWKYFDLTSADGLQSKRRIEKRDFKEGYYFTTLSEYGVISGSFVVGHYELEVNENELRFEYEHKYEYPKKINFKGVK